MRAGIDESLGHVGCALGIAAAPSTAMDKNVDRRVGLFSYIDVELLDLGRAVGEATGRAKTGQRGGALLSVALGDFACVGGPRRLIVGKIDLVFVVVEKDEWTLRFWRHSRRQVRLHLLGQYRSSRG